MTSSLRAPSPSALLCLALAACAGSPRHSSTARHHGLPLDARGPARTAVAPPLGAARLLGHEAGEASYYGVGGIRVRVRGTDAVLGPQPFAADLVGAARVRGGGWLFVTVDGTLARADDFVGALTRVGAVGAPVLRAFPWDGGLAVAYADGRVERVDRAGARTALPSTVLDDPSAAPTPAPEDEAATAAAAAVNGFPLARVALQSAALLPSGELVLRGGEHLYFADVSADLDVDVAARVALTGEPAGDCALLPWGARALLSCPTPAASPRAPAGLALFAASHDGVEPVPGPARAPLLVGREGHTLTFRGACPDRPAADAPDENTSLACTRDRDRGWREWQYPRAAWLLDVYDGTALFAERRDDAVELRLYDIDTARTSPVLLSDLTAEIARAGFTADGRVLVLAHGGTRLARRSLVGVARPGEAVVLRPVGFLARDVDMVDGRRGLVVGATARDVAETRDGGVTWLREDVALDGDLARVALEPGPAAPAAHTASERRASVQRVGEWVQCSTVLCRAGARLVHRWDDGRELAPAME